MHPLSSRLEISGEKHRKSARNIFLGNKRCTKRHQIQRNRSHQGSKIERISIHFQLFKHSWVRFYVPLNTVAFFLLHEDQ